MPFQRNAWIPTPLRDGTTDVRFAIYVADGGNARIQVFDNNLRLIAIYDAVGAPWALCITRGPHQYLYAASNDDRTDATRGRSTDQVYKMELDGTIVGRFGRSDNALGRFPTLHSIDCRSENQIVATGVDGQAPSVCNRSVDRAASRFGHGNHICHLAVGRSAVGRSAVIDVSCSGSRTARA